MYYVLLTVPPKFITQIPKNNPYLLSFLLTTYYLLLTSLLYTTIPTILTSYYTYYYLHPLTTVQTLLQGQKKISFVGKSIKENYEQLSRCV